MMNIIAESYASVIFEKKWKTDELKMKLMLVLVVLCNFVVNPFFFGVNFSRLFFGAYVGWISLVAPAISAVAVIVTFVVSFKIRKEMRKLEEAPMMKVVEDL